ncbi:hypothetical protein [Arenibacter palladensis]|uniref:hypothetical protein n=1 Tax=Arenibacter palladensis TaxID=237373 RepID=UPI0026E1E7B9|nr:hypothetical protein [Arenibacter palladensis]MDO6605682.1 hypothetical protein [Arenibacter palladensis]
MKKIFKIALVIIALNSLYFCFSQEPNKEKKSIVIVDYTKEIGKLRRPELYNNNSLLRTPSDLIAKKYKNEIGLQKIIRSWLTVEDFWDYKTDTYDYNFKCGWDTNEWDNYYDYLQRFSDISEELVLNVRGLHREVVDGKIQMTAWRKAVKNGILHYKTKYPKLKYIEALNEYSIGAFGGLSNSQYYKFYIEFYKIVNEINEALQPKIPLLIGGPVVTTDGFTDGARRDKLRDFLRNYANDANPKKKLDFISYHEYYEGEDPSVVAVQGKLIDEWCQEFGLPTDIPVQINEMGPYGGKNKNFGIEKDNLLVAAAMNSLFYFYNLQPDLQGFHWVMQHKTNDRKTQIFDNLNWTPYGMSLKMQSKMAEIQISATEPKLVKGKGVYSLASKNEKKITVMLWNYQWSEGIRNENVEVVLQNLPDRLLNREIVIKEYMLNSKFNNYFTGYKLFTEYGEDQLQKTNETIAKINKGHVKFTTELEPNAITLFEISEN